MFGGTGSGSGFNFGCTPATRDGSSTGDQYSTGISFSFGGTQAVTAGALFAPPSASTGFNFDLTQAATGMAGNTPAAAGFGFGGTPATGTTANIPTPGFGGQPPAVNQEPEPEAVQDTVKKESKGRKRTLNDLQMEFYENEILLQGEKRGLINKQAETLGKLDRVLDMVLEKWT